MTIQITHSSRTDQRPLVTFALFAYNQEKYICEAVEGALAQTYSPLEIIISDDCSIDRTFDLIKEAAERCEGLASLIINRNSHNLGIAAHINKIVKLAQGRIIVVAAGDDISMPERTSEIVKTFANYERCMGVYSCVLRIDENGKRLGNFCSKNKTNREDLVTAVNRFCPGLLGASHAWRREIFDFFGPLHPRVITEDRVLPLREALLGRICEIPYPLVRYRIHQFGVSQQKKRWTYNEYFRYHSKMWKQTVAALWCYKRDLNKYSQSFDDIKELEIMDAIKAANSSMKKAFICWKFYSVHDVFRQLKLVLSWIILTGDYKQSLRFLAARFFSDLYFSKLERQ